MFITEIQDDVLTAMQRMESNAFHGCLSDPPYGLQFMAQSWDRIVPPVEVWRELLRVLRPGALALIFGGTRTYHRLACNVEDAGFRVLTTLAWINGSGFPKAQSIGAMIDKSGCEPEQARLWQGYTTPQLKPAYEPIILAQKPLDGTYAENCMRWGCGGLNTDRCRISTNDNLNGGAYSPSKQNDGQWGTMHCYTGKDYVQPKGRWPANVILDEESAADIDAQSGNRKSGARTSKHILGDDQGNHHNHGIYGKYKAKPYDNCPASEGGASRFFQVIYRAKPSNKERNLGLDASPIKYIDGRSDAGRGTEKYTRMPSRNPHPTLKPIQLNTYLAKMILPPVDGKIIVPYAGVFSEAIGAMLAGWKDITIIEREQEYLDIGKQRMEAWKNAN